MCHRKLTCLGLFALLSLCGPNGVSGNRLRMCVVTGEHTSRKIEKNCPKLNVASSSVECVIENDRLSCLRNVAEGNSDFTVSQAEDLVVAAADPEYKVLVANELRYFPEAKRLYEVVALVRNDAGIQSLGDVRGKRLCHPGYEITDDWTPPLATFLENVLVEKECDSNRTLLENRIAAASTFFEAACMAGSWTLDSKMDSELKSRYRNLCALCNNPAGCYAGDKYHGREGALLCLTDQVGDIAWVRTADLPQHFKRLRIKKSEYSYLCNDGSVRSMETEEPCIWITRPWPVVVANAEQSEVVARLLSTLNTDNVPWHGALVRLLENHYLTSVQPDNLGTPDDYLQRAPGFTSAVSRATCKPSRTINWCVTSNVEERKCTRLSQAAFAYGLEPSIACNRESSRDKCMDAVRDLRVDLFVVTPEEEVTARRNGLKRVVHIFTNRKESIGKVSAVVRKSSNIKSFQQLGGLRACFAGYQSVGWNAFVSVMRNISGSGWDSSDSTSVANFFGSSCVLGIGKSYETMPESLYSLCKQAGNYGNETETLECLVSGGGDVAFVDLNSINKTIGYQKNRVWAESLKNDELIPVCFNESNPDTCYLAWTTLGSVMVGQNVSDVRFEEIYSLLLEIDELFGQKFKGQTPSFLMYGNYDGNRSVIFPEQTQHLQGDISHVRLERSYTDVVEDLIKNPFHSGTHRFDSSAWLTTILLVTITVINRLSSSCSDLFAYT